MSEEQECRQANDSVSGRCVKGNGRRGMTLAPIRLDRGTRTWYVLP